MASIGSLEVGLQLNRANFDASLAKVKADLAGLAGVNTQIKINIAVDTAALNQLNTKLTETSQTWKRLEQEFSKPLTVKVDDSQLTALNQHFELKKTHFQEIQNFFNSNPLTIKVDDSKLVALNKQFDLIEARFKQLRGEINQPIDVSFRVQGQLPSSSQASLPGSSTQALTGGYLGQNLLSGGNINPQQVAQNVTRSIFTTVINDIAQFVKAFQNLMAQQLKGGQNKNLKNIEQVPGAGNLSGTGQDLGQGLAQGLNQSSSIVVAASTALAKIPEKVVRQITETNSPSKVFERIGQYLAEGLGIGLNQGLSTLGTLQLGALLVQPFVMAAQAIVGTFNNIVGGSFSAAENLERVKTKLDAVTGSGVKANSVFKEFQSTALQYGLNATNLLGESLKIDANAVGSSLEGQGKNIIQQLAPVFRAKQIGGEQQSQILDAFNRLIEEGQINPRVITRTLPEALPGAFGAAARSQGLSNAQFLQLVKSGQVNVESFLPQFINQLNTESQGQLNEANNSPLTKLAQTQTRLELLQQSLGGGLLQAAGAAAGVFNGLFDVVAKGAEIFSALAVVIGGPMAINLAKTLPLVQSLQSGFAGFLSLPFGTKMSAIGTGLKELTLSLVELSAQLVVVYAAFEALKGVNAIIGGVNTDLKKADENFPVATKNKQQQPNNQTQTPTITGNIFKDFFNQPRALPLYEIPGLATKEYDYYRNKDISAKTEINLGFINKQYTPAYISNIQNQIAALRDRESTANSQANYLYYTGTNPNRAAELKKQAGQYEQQIQELVNRSFDKASLQENLKRLNTQQTYLTNKGDIAGLTKNKEEINKIKDTLAQINNITKSLSTDFLTISAILEVNNNKLANAENLIQRQQAIGKIGILQGQISGKYGEQSAQLAGANLEINTQQNLQAAYGQDAQTTLAKIDQYLGKKAVPSGNLTNNQELSANEKLGKYLNGQDLKTAILSGSISDKTLDTELATKNYTNPTQAKIFELIKNYNDLITKTNAAKESELQQTLRRQQLETELTKLNIERAASFAQSNQELASLKADASKINSQIGINRQLTSGSIGTVQSQLGTAQVGATSAEAKLQSNLRLVRTLGEQIDNLKNVDPAAVDLVKKILRLPSEANLKSFAANSNQQIINERTSNIPQELQGLYNKNGNAQGLVNVLGQYGNANQTFRQAGLEQSNSQKAIFEAQLAQQDAIISLTRQFRSLGESIGNFGRSLNKQILDAANSLAEAKRQLSELKLSNDVKSLLNPGTNGFVREMFAPVEEYIKAIDDSKNAAGKRASDKLSIQDQTINLAQQELHLEEQKFDLARAINRQFGTSGDVIVNGFKSIAGKITTSAGYADTIAKTFKSISEKLGGVAIKPGQPSGNIAPASTAVTNTVAPLQPIKVPKKHYFDPTANWQDALAQIPDNRSGVSNKYEDIAPGIASPLPYDNYGNPNTTVAIIPVGYPNTNAQQLSTISSPNLAINNLPSTGEFSPKIRQLGQIQTEKLGVDADISTENLRKAQTDATEKQTAAERALGLAIHDTKYQLEQSDMAVQKLLRSTNGYQTLSMQAEDQARSTAQEYKSQIESNYQARANIEKELETDNSRLGKIKKIYDNEFKKRNVPENDPVVQNMKKDVSLLTERINTLNTAKDQLENQNTALTQAYSIATANAYRIAQRNVDYETATSLGQLQLEYLKSQAEATGDAFGEFGQKTAILQAQLENFGRTKSAQETIEKLGLVGTEKAAEIYSQVNTVNSNAMAAAQLSGNKFASGFEKGFEDTIVGLAERTQRPLEVAINAIRALVDPMLRNVAHYLSTQLTKSLFNINPEDFTNPLENQVGGSFLAKDFPGMIEATTQPKFTDQTTALPAIKALNNISPFSSTGAYTLGMGSILPNLDKITKTTTTASQGDLNLAFGSLNDQTLILIDNFSKLNDTLGNNPKSISGLASNVMQAAGISTNPTNALNTGNGSILNFIGGLFGGDFLAGLFNKGGLVGNYASGGVIGLGMAAAQALNTEYLQNGGTNPILAALTPGEYVIPKNQVNDLLNPKFSPIQNLKNTPPSLAISNGTTNNQSSDKYYSVSNNWSINYSPDNLNSMSDSQIRAQNQMQAERSFSRFGQ